jgi:uncharacterized membrane protein
LGYLWLKALHVAAALTWIGGLFAASLTLRGLSAPAGSRAPGEQRMIEGVRRWDRCATTPAMLLLWGLGMTMAVEAGWFAAPWLMIKLAFVLGLSALHAALSGTLRRVARRADRRPPAFLRYAAPAIVASVLAIAILAVVKPF